MWNGSPNWGQVAVLGWIERLRCCFVRFAPQPGVFIVWQVCYVGQIFYVDKFVCLAHLQSDLMWQRGVFWKKYWRKHGLCWLICLSSFENVVARSNLMCYFFEFSSLELCLTWVWWKCQNDFIRFSKWLTLLTLIRLPVFHSRLHSVGFFYFQVSWISTLIWVPVQIWCHQRHMGGYRFSCFLNMSNGD